mmetsp:Transcript_40374/g.124813  ORF Transcript_40374/g.124813 Transcript_40374/m.124813 type:complete len:771 (-) Transcript_40374:30-2342(-)
MAGRIFGVFRQARWSPIVEECPQEMQGTSFTLTSADGEVFDVPGEAACLSGLVRKNVKLYGAGVEVDTQLSKATLGKLVEYLKFHAETPPAEIQVPLMSDNLVDCGALKWDATFINVDKEALFDLFMAAHCMDVPSLEVLAAAKAALLFRGKTADKLRKDAGMEADMEAEEEAELSNDYLGTQPFEMDPEEPNLAGLAVVMQGMVKAAERSGVLHESRGAKEPMQAPDLKSWRSWSWQAVVAADWRLLTKAPDEIRADRDVMIAAMGPSNGVALKLATDDLKEDKQVVLAALAAGGDLADAAYELRADRRFLMEAVMAEGTSLEKASDLIRGDRSFLLEAARKGRGSAMKGASEKLSLDKDFVLDCTALDPEAYRYAAPKLRGDRGFAAQVLRRNGMALQYALPRFKADRELVAMAMDSNPESLVFAHTAARADIGAAAPWDPEVPSPATPACGGSKGAYTGSRHVGLSLTQDAREQGMEYYHVKAQKSVQFSALSSLFANMGQGNYIAANMALDKFPFYQRPTIDAVTVMWGAVGNIGMRWKAFASQDFLNATPEILMTIEDCCKILHALTCRMDTPEWTTAALNVGGEMLMPTAGMLGGFSPGGGFRPGEDAGMAIWPGELPTPSGQGKPGRRAERAREGEEEQRQRQAEAEAGPLGGWPLLDKLAAEAPAYSQAELQLVEGARVRLTGLQAKNGMTGVALQHFQDSKGGKWKVSLDGSHGSAQLKECYLEVLAPPEPDWRARVAAEAKAARVAKKAGTARASQKARA